MHTMSEKDKEKGCDDKAPKIDAMEGFGLAKRKGCTDLLALAMFVAAMFVMTTIGLDAAKNSNVQALINAVDYKGRVCGVDADVKSKPYGYVIDRELSIVCVDECPDSTDETGVVVGWALPTAYEPTGKLDGVSLGYSANLLICKDDYDTTASVGTLVGQTEADFGVGSSCMFAVQSDKILDYCIPGVSELSLSANATSNFAAQFGLGDTASYMMEFVGDIMTAHEYIFGFGTVVALLVGFAFTYVLRLPGLLYMTVWIIIVVVFFFFGLIGGVMYSTYERWNDQDPQEHESYEVKGMRIVSFIFFALAILWALAMCVMRKRINLAIALTKETAKAIEDLKTVVLLPLVFLAAFLVFALVWAMYSFALMAKGEYVTTYQTNSLGNVTSTKTWEFEQESEYTQYYMLFCFFWGQEFISAMSQLVLALAFACWYFTKDKSETGPSTVGKALGIGLRYHTGTAAAGSLIIAIIKTIRAFVAHLQAQAEKHGGKAAKIILCCIQSCLWCVEKCMKFINKNAYIQTAIYGTSFCASAKAAFFLICRNILRIAAVGVVSEIVVFIGRWFIIIATTALAYVCMDRILGDELHSLVGPCIFVAFFAYAIASLFMSVFAMGISTMLQCFIADEEMHPDVSERYASASLISFIGEAASGAKKNDSAKKV